MGFGRQKSDHAFRQCPIFLHTLTQESEQGIPTLRGKQENILNWMHTTGTSSSDCIGSLSSDCSDSYSDSVVCLNIETYIKQSCFVTEEEITCYQRLWIDEDLSLKMSNEIHLEGAGEQTSSQKNGVYKELRANPYLLGLSTVSASS